jgi:hypothetical protein
MRQTAVEIALLDSGATENFLDEKVCKELNLGCFKLPKPLTVYNVDGMENRHGKVDYCCWLKVHYGGKMLRMQFFVTNLGKDRFILGYPFLFDFNPRVDWQKAILEDGAVRLKTIGFKRAQERVERYQALALHCVGELEADEVVWIRKLTTAQQWAHEARHKQEGPSQILPDEYKQH